VPSGLQPASLTRAAPAAVLPARAARTAQRARACGWLLATLALGLTLDAGRARAFTATLTPAAPLTVYLQVGVGSFNSIYINGGTPQNNTTINTVSVAVAATEVGTGTAQAMTTDSTAANSFWDGFAFCNLPSQLYIGGFYRTTGGKKTSAQVTATVPTSLIDAGGSAIPFSSISWTSSGNADTGGEPFPAGTFPAGGVKTVGSMSSNTWNESCLSFSYANLSIPAAGTFTGRVLYTLSAP
jgi:hypothetical protein